MFLLVCLGDSKYLVKIKGIVSLVIQVTQTKNMNNSNKETGFTSIDSGTNTVTNLKIHTESNINQLALSTVT